MRHRQLVRTTARVGVLVALSVCISACASGDSPPPSPHPARGAAPAAVEINTSTGEIVRPIQRFFLSEEERYVLSDAGGIARSRCAAARGVTFSYPVSEFPDVYRHSNYYGVWLESFAERFAFVKPSTDADLAANNVSRDGAPVTSPPSELREASVTNALLTDADWAIIDECSATPEVAQFNESSWNGPWTEQLNAAFQEAQDGDATHEVYDELDQCFIDNGMEPDTDTEFRGNVKGADYMSIDEQQIKLALKVVDCKDQVDLIRRLSQIEADLEAPIIEKYSKELTAQREDLDEVLAKARIVVAEHLAGQ